MVENWTKEKPKEPGRYLTRWQYRPNPAFEKERCFVTVKKKGRGLVVIPDPPYRDEVRMSEIGKDELEWMKLEE